MTSNKIFFPYSSYPNQIGITIEETAQHLKQSTKKTKITTWKQIDIPGRFIVEGIFEKIDAADIVVADLTQLNFNVVFEIGYAIGKSKRAFLVINASLTPPKKEFSQLGIFDTLGYQEYSNSIELLDHIKKIIDISPLSFPNYLTDKTSPIYLLDTLYKTDASIRIVSKIKKARINFRSHDPNEQPRLSLLDAYKHVKKSIAVIINLLSSRATDYQLNNLRGAFIAGLSYSLEKETLILQEGDEPVPLDYRDFVSVYKHPQDVDSHINDLAPKVMEHVQQLEEIKKDSALDGFLPNLELGAPAAENEMTSLGNYYFETDEYKRALQGVVRLAVGRKGSGKTALFFQVRDRVRQHKKNVVLDLKPEGHQLKRFRDVILLLGEAVQEHVATAFWEYVLLLEICHKLLQKDKFLHTRDHSLFDQYKRLEELYSGGVTIEEADFSERILNLVNRITDDFQEKYGTLDKPYLKVGDVNQLIYKHSIPALRDELVKYLKLKGSVWILFDNIDKGWPTRGVGKTDIIILRALLDSTRKIERLFQKDNIGIVTIVFLRNDVYELLVDESPDRGKESRVSLDWSDSERLKEFIRLRFISNGLQQDTSFQSAWNSICASHINGEDTAEYLILRSLMRPRYFLTLVNHCKSNAVNFRHSKIKEKDIEKACETYSADLVNEIGLEIRDVFPNAEDILYYFIAKPSYLALSDIKDVLKEAKLDNNEIDRLIEILFWFGFLGVRLTKNGDLKDTYIYDVLYDMKKMKRLCNNFNDDSLIVTIHCAFWPFLEIELD
jgi:hypothetical protein